jgi:hypothetical protein
MAGTTRLELATMQRRATFAIHPESAKERSRAEHENADCEGERSILPLPLFLYWQYHAAILWNRIISGLVETSCARSLLEPECGPATLRTIGPQNGGPSRTSPGTPDQCRLCSRWHGALQRDSQRSRLPSLASSFFSFHRETAAARSHAAPRFLGV